DMIIVGKFAGTISMSGVNIGSQITMLVTNLVIGLTVGATVLIGQYLGAGDRNGLKETIGTLFTSLFFSGIVITVLMVFLRIPILRLIQTPVESFPEAENYFFVTALGTLFIFAYNALSAIMRGMGDSKNPLIFVAIACVVNVVLDLVLVAVFGMGATGAAVATVVSQAVSMVLCVVYLKRNNFVFDFNLESFKCNYRRLKMILRIGIPSSVQNVAVSCSFLFLTAMVNSLGVNASAAVGAVGKLNGFAILPAVAMNISVSAMSAQNIGAGKHDRALKTCGVGIMISYIISAVIFTFVTIFPELCMRMFIDDEAVIRDGIEYLGSFKYDYLLVPAVFCMNGLFIGAGHTTLSLISGIMSSVLFRIPACYLFGMVMDMGLKGIGLGAPVASASSFVLCIVFLISGRWKKQVIVHSNE
ncbi:MAG: MATE family efflux transporter, partial [Clostridia bacterium]|nr:MATE family efflux transporter [Clostridia bacterium]